MTITYIYLSIAGQIETCEMQDSLIYPQKRVVIGKQLPINLVELDGKFSLILKSHAHPVNIPQVNVMCEYMHDDIEITSGIPTDPSSASLSTFHFER